MTADRQPRRPRAARAAALALSLVQLAATLSPAAPHAVMIDPQSRPWLDYLENYNYLPHQVYGGGVQQVSKGGALSWPARSVSSVCGDAAGEGKWDRPGRITKTYQAGSTINVDVIFAQNHLGRLNVRVCPLKATDEKQCVTLQRAASGNGRGGDLDLPWTQGWYGVTSGFVPPGNSEGFKTYKMPPVTKKEGCKAWACDQFREMFVYRVAYKLPSGFTCDHCKMQMFYLTGSRCWPPCANPKGCSKPVPYKYCGEPGATYPEEFWNCADIKIQGGGSGRRLSGAAHLESVPDRFPELGV